MSVTVSVSSNVVDGVVICKRVIREGLEGDEINDLILRLHRGGYEYDEIWLENEQGVCKSAHEIIEKRRNS